MASKMQRAATYVFTHPDQKAAITVPDGNRIMLLAWGHSPVLAPVDEPGQYEIDAEPLAKGRWPVAMVVIDLAHVAAWLALPAAHVDEILSRLAAPSKGR